MVSAFFYSPNFPELSDFGLFLLEKSGVSCERKLR
jgi:hypothetical protein